MVHAELTAHISILMFSKILPSLFMHLKSYIEKGIIMYTLYPCALLVHTVESFIRSRPCNEEEKKHGVLAFMSLMMCSEPLIISHISLSCVYCV